MNTENHPASSNEPSENISKNSPTRSNGNKVLTIMIVLVLLGAVGYGSYSIGSKNKPTSMPTDQSSTVKKSTTTSSTSFHTVVYGSTDVLPKVAIKLAFPQNYQAIAYDNGPDSFRSLFGDNSGNFIYHRGNWQIGNPNDGIGSNWGNIGIMGIAPDWYNRNGFATYGGFNGDAYASDQINTKVNGYDFSTSKQKNLSITKLVSDTSDCSKDPSKGFSLSGGFNICYTPILIKQAYASYNPQIQLSGYAIIKGVPYVMFGYVGIAGGLDGYQDAALDKAGQDFQAGKIPGPTQKNIDTFIQAFKQGSVSFK